MSRNTLSQYVWLADKIYRTGKISLRQINEDRLRDGYDIIPERTFHKWKDAIEDMFGISIKCENKGDYRYYICSQRTGQPQTKQERKTGKERKIQVYSMKN